MHMYINLTKKQWQWVKKKKKKKKNAIFWTLNDCFFVLKEFSCKLLESRSRPTCTCNVLFP